MQKQDGYDDPRTCHANEVTTDDQIFLHGKYHTVTGVENVPALGRFDARTIVSAGNEHWHFDAISDVHVREPLPFSGPARAILGLD